MALLKDGTRIYGNAIVDSNATVGGTLTASNIIISTGSDSSQVLSYPTSSGDGGGYNTLRLIPDSTITSDQYIILDPTAPNHIHIRAGGTQDDSNAQLIMGGENSNFIVDAGLNPSVYVTSNSYVWTFSTSGAITTQDANVAISGNIVLESNGNIVFSDSTIQTTAYQVVKSTYNAQYPSVRINNAQFNIDSSWNPTVGAISGTWSGGYTATYQTAAGGSYVVYGVGSSTATWTSIASYGFGVTFGAAGDRAVGLFSDDTNGHQYRVTWVAGSGGTGYGFIEVEQLI